MLGQRRAQTAWQQLKRDSDKTAKKEEEGDDVTQQVPVPPDWGVYKQNLVMNQLGGGVHDNTDGTFDDEVIQIPPISQGISKLGQVTCQTNNNVHPFMTGRRQNVAPPHK